jgi:hypothetical protein
MMKWRVVLRLDSGSLIGEEERWVDCDDREKAREIERSATANGITLTSKESGSSRSWPASSVKYIDIIPVLDDGNEPTADQEDA